MCNFPFFFTRPRKLVANNIIVYKKKSNLSIYLFNRYCFLYVIWFFRLLKILISLTIEEFQAWKLKGLNNQTDLYFFDIKSCKLLGRIYQGN